MRKIVDFRKSIKGITLISLVVTIIVLIILASVSINLILGENGIIQRAKQASTMQVFSTYLNDVNLKKLEMQMNNKALISITGEEIKNYVNIKDEDIEKFAIIDGELIYIGHNSQEIEIAKSLNIKVMNKDLEELEVLIFVIDIVNNDKQKQGIELIDMTGSSTNWAIVTEISKQEQQEINKKYGTGYYYLKSETEVNGKNIQNSYIIDYASKTIINCNSKEYNYAYIDINSSLGVRENLILNLDAKNLSDSSEWGKGVSLYKYDETIYPDQVTFTNAVDGYDRETITDLSKYVENNSFKFNGNNYIEIYNESAFDFSNGLTFEFYGKIDGNAGPYSKSTTNNYTGLFGVWNGNYSRQATVRFGIEKINNLFFNFATASPNSNSLSSHPQSTNSPWNQRINIQEVWDSTEDIYLSITLNKPQEEGEEAEYYVYINGEKYIDNGWISDPYWKGFMNNLQNLNYFEVGRCTMIEPKNWSYLIGNAYTIRLYNRYLTDAEIKENYDKTLAYHLIS